MDVITEETAVAAELRRIGLPSSPLAINAWAAARSCGLAIVAFNAVRRRDALNGIRVFVAERAPFYFAGNHIYQAPDLEQLRVWLAGYAAARRQASSQ